MMRLLNAENGFTMVEVMIAQVVLLIGALSILGFFIMGSRINAESEDKTIAVNIAQLKMEEIMNTRFRYIVEEHPAGETMFSSEPQARPFWTPTSNGGWTLSLPGGRYEISYPDGEDMDPLRIMVRISWQNCLGNTSSLSLESLVSMTPGRFRDEDPYGYERY